MLKKLSLVIILCLMLSGCTIRYDIEITKDLEVIENVSIMEKNNRFIEIGTTNEAYLDLMYNIYSNDDSYNQYEFKKKISNLESGIISKTRAQKIDDFLRYNKVKKTLFGEININRVDNKVIFSASKYRGSSFFDVDDTVNFKSEEIIFTLKTPFNVYRHNADEYNEKKGLYSWKFYPDTINKEVEIVFSDDLSLLSRIKFFFIDYYVVFIIIILLIVSIIGIGFRNKKVNKI